MVIIVERNMYSGTPVFWLRAKELAVDICIFYACYLLLAHSARQVS